MKTTPAFFLIIFLISSAFAVAPANTKYAMSGDYVYGYVEKTVCEINTLFFDETSSFSKTFKITDKTSYFFLDAFGYTLKTSSSTVTPWSTNTNGVITSDIGQATYLFSKNAKDIFYFSLTTKTNLNTDSTMCLAPGQGCSDGTSPKTCSATKPKYCDSTIKLVDSCGACGCPDDYPICKTDESCSDRIPPTEPTNALECDTVYSDCSPYYTYPSCGSYCDYSTGSGTDPCYDLYCQKGETCVKLGTRNSRGKCCPLGYIYSENYCCPSGTAYNTNTEYCE